MAWRSRGTPGTSASTTRSSAGRWSSGSGTCRRGCTCAPRPTGIYDPLDRDTIERYLAAAGIAPAAVDPFPLDKYLGYAEWFQRQKGITIRDGRVHRLDAVDGGRLFEATLDGGGTISARNVVIAVGFGPFPHVPETLSSLIPPGRLVHTCDFTDLASLEGKRVLIIGGRQSAFEWAALLREGGARSVAISHRHASPAFRASGWTWVGPLVDRFVTEPGWYRRLSEREREEISHRQWAEGRLKLEPWLAPRIDVPEISVFPGSVIVSWREQSGGALRVTLTTNTVLEVDAVVLATGYKVDVARIPMLSPGNLASRLETRNGFPALSDRLESNIPGLFLTSMCAAQDFGPFFGFTVAARASARLIGDAVRG